MPTPLNGRRITVSFSLLCINIFLRVQNKPRSTAKPESISVWRRRKASNEAERHTGLKKNKKKKNDGIKGWFKQCDNSLQGREALEQSQKRLWYLQIMSTEKLKSSCKNTPHVSSLEKLI